MGFSISEYLVGTANVPSSQRIAAFHMVICEHYQSRQTRQSEHDCERWS